MNSLTLSDFGRVVIRRWHVVVAAAIVGVLGGFLAHTTFPPQYQSAAKVFVATESAANVGDLAQGNTYVQQVVSSYAEVATSKIVLQRVVSSLNLPQGAASLSSDVSATSSSDSVVIEISVTQPSAVRAAQVANAVAHELGSVVRQLSPQGGNGSSTVKISTIQPAAVPGVASTPSLASLLILGGLGGLAAGILVLALLRAVDTRVRTRGQLEQLIAAPVIGAIRYAPEFAGTSVGSRSVRNSASEDFRELRTNLRYLDSGGGAREVVLTSAVEGEGKTTSAVSLATVMADADQKVCLIDGDLRRPSVAQRLGLEGEVGLTDVLIGDVSLEDALQTWGANGLTVLPSGALPPNPSELLQSESMSSLLAELASRFDIVIIDAPPLLPVSDAAILARKADGAILICAVGRARRQDVARAAAKLGQVGAILFGTVATMITRGAEGGYGYGYGDEYGDGYGYGHAGTGLRHDEETAKRPVSADVG